MKFMALIASKRKSENPEHLARAGQVAISSS